MLTPHPLLLACALLPALHAAEPTTWPTDFKPRAAKMVSSVDPASGKMVVNTAHYRIETDRVISEPDLQRFANVLESVPLVLEAIPMKLSAPPGEERIKILIYDDESEYVKAGGAAGTVGFYDGRRRQVLLIAKFFLNPPAYKPTRLKPRPNENLLVHELVHTNMHGIIWRTPPWLHEGTAEYFASAHRGNGWYTFHNIDSSIRDRIRRAAQPDEAGVVTLPSVGSLLDLDGREWLDCCTDTWRDNPFLPYTTALLLAHYHFHGGKERRASTAAYFASLHGLTRRDKTPAFKTEDAREIEAKLVKFWAPRGLNIKFAKE